MAASETSHIYIQKTHFHDETEGCYGDGGGAWKGGGETMANVGRETEIQTKMQVKKGHIFSHYNG